VEELGEIVQEFLAESHENLDQLDGDLVALEREPGSRDLLSRIFRTIHTIKGTSGFLAFNRLESLTHAGESLLSRLRDGVQPVTPATVTTLLAIVDGVRALLSTIEVTGAEGDVPVDRLIEIVNRQIGDGADPASDASPSDASPSDAASGPEASAREPGAELVVGFGATSGEDVGDEAGRRPIGELLIETGGAVDADVSWALQRQVEGDDRKLGAILLEEGKTMTSAVNEALAAQQSRRSVTDSAIRVDVDLLDSLMNLVGELVLVRNQLVRAASEVAEPVIVRTTQRLNLITSELQEGIMKTRMQPIDHLWSKLPRVVRDLSQACGKQVKIAMEGKETELDRSLLEAVKDPLTHLVRNAIDHGVEEPRARVAAGKAPEGTLTLRAYHEGGHVTVEVTDDGAGIDLERVRQTAVARGVVRPEQADELEPRDVMMLVFQPGFSTAQAVTNVSGRGVGMDVVKTNIERIGGAVDVESTLGQGTTWRLTIPLTLAIIQALTIECAGERYVVPQVAVHELVYIDGQSTRIEYIADAPVYRLRGKLLPLVRLDTTLGLSQSTDDKGVYVVVLQADGRRFGMVVDRVLNTEEVVVKALTARFKDIGMYAGATILGDGKVALILDVPSVARRSHLAGGAAAEREAAALALAEAVVTGPVDRLLITGVGDRRVAIPLDTVTRLEEFPVDRIERVGSREVVQYRGQILPLVRLSYLLGVVSEDTGGTVSMIVYTERRRSVALIVDRIVDIVESATGARGTVAGGDGLIGSAVIGQRVTELLDVRRAILAADPQFYSDVPVELVEA
jgi:two-component system chemotaxis sensor kinase CheA